MSETCGVNNHEINRRDLGRFKEILFFKDGKAVIRMKNTPTHQLLLLRDEVHDLEKVLRQT